MRDIPDYEGRYAVTSCGKIWSYKFKRFLKPFPDKDGYMVCNLISADYKRHRERVCRLVAKTYIPNPDNLDTVDHIDCIKTHDYIDNLRWLSRSDNSLKRWGKEI